MLTWRIWEEEKSSSIRVREEGEEKERRRIQSEPDDGNDVFEVTFDGYLTVIKNALMLGTEEER